MKRFKFIAAALAFLGLQSAQASDAPATLKVGDKAPNFTLTSNDNQQVSLSDYKGKDIVLMFSRAHWWPFCIKQLVRLQKQKAEFDQMGIQMLCVFREEKKGPEGAQKATKKSGFSPILLDTPTNLTKAYSQKGFSTYLIGKDGKIKAIISGSKTKRPNAEVIIEKAKEVFNN